MKYLARTLAFLILLAALVPATARAQSVDVRPFFRNLIDLPVIDARKDGVKADGVTSDSTALQTAIDRSDAAGGGVIMLPRGDIHLATGVTLRCKNTVIRGQGMYVTKIKGAAVTLLETVAGPARDNVVLEDLGFEFTASQTNPGIRINGSFIRGFTARRCRFYLNGNGPAAGLDLRRPVRVVIEDCLFEGNASFGGGSTGLINNALRCVEGGHDVKIRNTEFWWCNDALLLDTADAIPTDGEIIEELEVSGCLFEGGWWLLPYTVTGSGGTVTYTGTNGVTLTDTAASFSGSNVFTPNAQNVRAMPLLRTGTLASSDQTEVQDTGASFIVDGVKRGHIVRSGTLFAVVSAVESATKLRIEGWWDDTTRLPMQPPAASASYSVYGVLIGRVTGFTGTTLTVDRWHDLDGNTLTPTAGTRYELMPRRLGYPVHSEAGVRRARFLNNTFSRGWADQLGGALGGYTLISNNTFRDGQDMACTLFGDNIQFIDNLVERSGAGGLWTHGNNGLIANNVFVGPFPYQNSADTVYSAPIVLYALNATDSASRNKVIGNLIDGKSAVNGRYGITVANPVGTAPANNEIQNNTVRNVSVGGINLYNTHTGTRLRDNNATIHHQAGAVGADYGVLVGTGSPEGAVVAGVGTVYRRTDGGAGTSTYNKESGTGSTGWVAK